MTHDMRNWAPLILIMVVRSCRLYVTLILVHNNYLCVLERQTDCHTRQSYFHPIVT